VSKKYINREIYLQRIRPFINKNLIKILVGQRRVGKSFMLFQLIEEIKHQDSNSNIIYINKEDYLFEFIKESGDLVDFVESKAVLGKQNYLFIDEIQDIKHFEIALRHFFILDNMDVFCTGSNANLLSGELASYLSGRYVEFKIYSLSFTEFLQFNKLDSTNKNLKKYLRVGGLPFLTNLPDDKYVINDYLKNIFSTVIYKDVISRYSIRNPSILELLVKYLAANVGNIISANKISNYLKSQQVKTSALVILNYLGYLRNAFLIYQVKRSDLTGKKIFELKDKFYFEDWGLSNTIVGSGYFDIGKTIENVIYIHLLIAGYDVTIGQYGEKEIDFVAVKDGRKIYIQACYLIPDEKVKEREFGNLLLIKDNYPKYVVSLDEYLIGNFEGIRHLHLKDFLELVFKL
jgi:predicted AAA+ superfamily ATPase